MVKQLLVVVLIILLIIGSGMLMVRNTVKTTINRRLDASEGVMLNTLDGRLSRDFSSSSRPTDVIYSPNSFEYRVGDEVVILQGGNNTIDINVREDNGTSNLLKMKGDIEVDLVDIVNIGNNIKVDLRNTTSKVYAVTFRIYEDVQKNRVSFNREFTRYLTVVDA